MVVGVGSADVASGANPQTWTAVRRPAGSTVFDSSSLSTQAGPGTGVGLCGRRSG